MHIPHARELILWGDISIQWMVMQHHGAPTRCLDWTQSLWIAAYFACSGDLDDGAAAARILAFDRHVLNNAFAKTFPAEAESWRSDMLDEAKAEKLSGWVNTLYLDDGPKFPRLIAQQGAFTFASRPQTDHWDGVKRLMTVGGSDANGPTHVEILVAAAARTDILVNLDRMGINGSTMYPDIHGVSKWLIDLSRIARLDHGVARELGLRPAD